MTGYFVALLAFAAAWLYVLSRAARGMPKVTVSTTAPVVAALPAPLYALHNEAILAELESDTRSRVRRFLEYWPDTYLLKGYRGKAEQEKEYSEGDSNAHFGESPHNYRPALAVDAAPVHDGKIDYSGKATPAREWDARASTATTVGLVSGHYWSRPDSFHLEAHSWRSKIGAV